MKDQLKITFILLAGILLSAAPYLPANPTTTAMLASLARKKANAGGSGGLATFGDDFSTDPSARWNAVSGGGFSWNGNPDFDVDVLQSTQWIYTADTCDTQSQWVYAQVTATTASVFAGLVLRSPNATGSSAYALRLNNGSLLLRSIDGHSGDGDIFEWMLAIDVGDYFGFTVTGSGAATEFVLYDFGSSDPGGGPNAVNWGTASEDSQTVNSGNWSAHANPATGSYAGFYNGSANENADFDNFNAGDWTP